MAIYSRKFTFPASSEKTFDLPIEGDIISMVRIRFPPGPQGLLETAIYYGTKQWFPYEEDTRFFGDDEIIQWDEWVELPEYRTTLRIYGQNRDDTYDHTLYLVLNVKDIEDTLPFKIAKFITVRLKRLMGLV